MYIYLVEEKDWFLDIENRWVFSDIKKAKRFCRKRLIFWYEKYCEDESNVYSENDNYELSNRKLAGYIQRTIEHSNNPREYSIAIKRLKINSKSQNGKFVVSYRC
jgi:hypothetical protein